MNAINPYESPVGCPGPLPVKPTQTWAINWIRFPASALMVLAGTQMLVISVFVVRVLLWISRKHQVTISKLLEQSELTIPLLSFGCCLFICIGATRMWELRSLWFCRMVAIAACIPVVTPLVWIGVPFGIWAAVLLFRKDVAAKFGRA
jgi:hypothetical protein